MRQWDMVLTTKKEYRKRVSQASASILGRVANRKNWNGVIQYRSRQARWASMSFTVLAYASNFHGVGYSESEAGVPHSCRVLYKINVRPKPGQPQLRERPL